MADSNKWLKDKIKSGIAEAACRSHFEALGYTVENFGIEHIAPQYTVNSRKSEKDSFLEEFKDNLQKMPDFLISGTYPDTADELAGRTVAGKTVALLVEAKYVDALNLTIFNKEMEIRYENLIRMRISFMIYVVARNSRTNGHPHHAKAPDKCTVHIGLFETSKEPIWLKAGEKTKLNKFPLTVGCNGSGDFNTVYSDIVQPCLSEIFSGEN